MNQFKITFNLFNSSLVSHTYDTWYQWMECPDVLKAVALYVKFYDQITLAYHKLKSNRYDEEEAVSTVMQYLCKNVEIIVNDHKRFTPNYIYKIAFNAIYPLTRRISDEGRVTTNVSLYELFEPSTEVESDDVCTYIRYLDRAISYDHYSFDSSDLSDWIETLDESMQKLAEDLINHKKLGKKQTKLLPEFISVIKHLMNQNK